MRDWYLFSKFKLAIAVFLSGCAFLAFGKIESAQWLSLTIWTMGLYFGANVAEAATTKKAGA